MRLHSVDNLEGHSRAFWKSSDLPCKFSADLHALNSIQRIEIVDGEVTTQHKRTFREKPLAPRELPMALLPGVRKREPRQQFEVFQNPSRPSFKTVGDQRDPASLRIERHDTLRAEGKLMFKRGSRNCH